MSDISSRLRQASTIYDGSYPPSILPPVEPNPRITTLAPNTVAASAAAVTVTVTGSNFTDQSVIEINQVAQPTTFVSATSLTTSYDPTVAGSVPFTVRDGQGESNSVVFTVTAGAEEEPVTTNEPEPTQQGVSAGDVAGWTVDQAMNHVIAHPADIALVRGFEETGKARVTLLDWLDEYEHVEHETETDDDA